MHIIVLFGTGPWVLQHIIDLLGSGSYELIRRGRGHWGSDPPPKIARATFSVGPSIRAPILKKNLNIHPFKFTFSRKTQ